MKEAAQILAENLDQRKAVNPGYSLRAFARDLGLSAPQLSNVMSGKRGLSQPMAEKVSSALHLDLREKEWFKESLKAKFSLSKAERVVATSKLAGFEEDASETKFLDLDLFKTVSNWYHFTLIELIKISKSQKNPVPYFSEKLGVSENEVILALGRLERLELIEKAGKTWKVNQDTVFAEQAVPGDAVKNFHRQILEKSIQALVFQSGKERYGYSGAMPIKIKSVDRAKKLIQKFRSDFAKEISDHEDGQEIYGLSLQFFRLTQKTNLGEMK